MDDEGQDGPLTFWQMFNTPTIALFKNLDHAIDGLERLLVSVLKSTSEFSEVLVPRQGISKSLEENYLAFDFWFIGRIYYILSVKSLERIHTLSKETQLKILHILYINDGKFFNTFEQEYISLLNELICYYKRTVGDNSSNGQNVTLKYFTPNNVNLQTVDLDLTPIYVELSDIDGCRYLIDYTLQILAHILALRCTNFHMCKDKYETVFEQTLDLLENCDIKVKIFALHFYTDLIGNATEVGTDNFNEIYPSVFRRLLHSTEALVSSLDVILADRNNQFQLIERLPILLEKLLSVIQYCSHGSDDAMVLSGICITILNHDNKKRYSSVEYKHFLSDSLRRSCLSVMKNLNVPESSFPIDYLQAEELSIVSDYLKQKVIDYAVNVDCEIIDIATQLRSNCYCYRMLCQACSILDATLDGNLDEFVIQKHVNKCRSVLRILTCAQVEYNVCIKSTKTNGLSTLKKLYSSEFVSSLLNSLVNMFTIHKNAVLTNEFLLSTMMDILLGLAMISNVNQYRTILSLTCLEIHDTCGNLDHLSQKAGLQRAVLENLLVQNLVSTVKFDTDWKKHVSILLRSISRIKDHDFFEYVIRISPLLLFNKVFNPSKLIAEFLHPALSNGDQNVHEQLILKLPIIICIALGDTALVQATQVDKHIPAHTVHVSGISNMRLICLKCHGRHNHADLSILWKFDSSAVTSSAVQVGIISLLEKFLNKKLYAYDVNNLINLIVSCSQHSVFSLCSANYISKVETLQTVVPVIRTYVNNILFDEKMEDSKRDTMFSTCLNVLLTNTKTSLDTNNIALQNTTLECVREFGSVTGERVILPSTKLLVYFLMHPQCTLGSQASLYLQHVCEAHGGCPNKMYHRYKRDYCKQFVACSLYNGRKYASSILKVVRAFGFVGYRDFMSKDVHHFLPYLLPFYIKINYVKTMIEEISSLIQCTPSDFLVERFPHLYTHIHLHESDEVAAVSFKLVESMTGMTIPNLIKRHFRVILTELLLQYCCGPEKVLKSCKWLTQNDPDQPNPSNAAESLTMSQIADFIEPRFLGVLAYFDNKLVNAKVALSVKRKALQSFPDIIKLMGSKYITPLRFKVLATLRSALSLVEEFPKILAQAWSAFICNIDTITLGPLLTTLSISLLQQLNHAPVEINKIFKFLILSNENLLSTYIPDLFFLEESNVSDRVKSVISKHVRMTQPETFLERVKWFLKYLGQDIGEVRYYAMKCIDQLLRKSRKEIHNAIFGGKAIDPAIVDLFDYLNKLCTESDARVQVWSARCLGQLGALETGLLPRSYSQPQAQAFPFFLTNPVFATAALLELTRACQYENDTKNMDCYALTIQEILKVYDISPSGENKDIWAGFSDNMHQIMLPLLSSRYTLAFPSRPKKTHPLFGSRHASTFVEWAFNWAGQLISLVEGEDVQELLRTVHPSMRRDYSTLVLFLPYVVLHAVTSNKDNAFIREEIMAVIGLDAFNKEKRAPYIEAKYKMLRNIFMTPAIATTTIEDGTQTKCCKMMYVLLDFLNRWLLEWSHTQSNALLNANYKTIKSFVDSFCKRTIAQGNFLCGEFERSLQYLERYMEESPDQLQEQLSLLAEIYAVLDEPDAVAGILTIKRSEPSLDELILAHEVTGRLQDAATCYERLAQEQRLTPQGLQGMVECYLGLDQPFTAHQLLLEPSGCDVQRMIQLAAEPYWRLGMFEQLEDLVKKPIQPTQESWGVVAGRCLLSVRAQDGLLTLHADAARQHLLTQLDGGAGRREGALRHAYPAVLGMHVLAEMEHTGEILQRLKELSDGEQSCTATVEELLGEWKYRLCLVDSSVRTIEPLLRMRRILLDQTKEILAPTHPRTAVVLDGHIGNIWLQSAKIARKADNFQQAYIYILNAEKYKPERLFIEKAKLYWARGQHESAFTTLKRGLEEHFPVMDGLRPEQKKICAKAKLLIATYNDETTNVDMDVNVSHYKEAVDAYRQWEKSLVSLAAYYEKVIASGGSGSEAPSHARRLQALSCYGRALLHGHRQLYQSMPRMLSIWLDYEIIPSDPNSIATLTQMSQIIESYSERLPLYLFLTAFSQIVSRICHPVKEVYTQLKAIIVRLIVAYPQHTLWMMMMVVQSGYAARVRRCQDVFAHPRLKDPPLLQLIHHFTQLAVRLIELCNKPVTGNVSTTQVSTLVRALPRLLSSDDFSHIMMPFEQFCKVVLPSKMAAQDQTEFKVSTEPLVYIAGIEEQVTILPSLQRPRKVTLRGSDGKPYLIMLKPKDDLRKDFRLMEFNGVVNGFLARDAAARARRLYIRTYAVLPLNEECGLIQWVPNLVGFRPILTHIYKQKGMYTGTRELREMMCGSKDPVSKKLAVFTDQLLPRHPPVFPEWFRKTFTDPYGWYQARSAYIRTTAVMSMVGYILGLGDRHGENILLDSTNGDCVHVDFNCLFNKGEAFEWAERVPFRLTHNMEAAMGPLGREGMYRKSCEVTMRALRSQAAPLLSVIRPFLYDPLVSWHRAGGRAAALVADVNAAERVNNQAKEHLHQIEQRLQGMVRNKNKQQSLLLSVEGQVDHLVLEATSVINLCQMYIGWGPFL